MDVQRSEAASLGGKRCDPSSWISTGTFSPFVVYSLNYFIFFEYMKLMYCDHATYLMNEIW